MMNFSKLLLLCLSLFHSTLGATEIIFEIKGVDGDAHTNVEDYLLGLELPKNAKNEGYLSEVKKSAQAALTVFGYYQPKIVIAVSDMSTTEQSEQRVILDIVTGPQTVIVESDIRILGEGKTFIHFTELLENFTLRKGDILLHTNYESAKSSFKSVARRYGYFDSKFVKSRVEVSSAKNSASVSLWFDSGPRYLFGDFIFESALSAHEIVTDMRNFEIGDPFDTKQLGELNANLSQTGYFKSISLLPDFSKKEGLNIPLNIVASMQPEDSFNIGLGVSSDEGLRGTFGWKRPWLNDAGHSIEGALVASIPKQEASLTYKMPLEDPLNNYISLQSGYQMENQNDTDTTLYINSITRHWRFDNQWHRNIFLRHEHESGSQGQQQFSTTLFIPGISFSRTRFRGGVNATWGDKIITLFETSSQWWFSSENLVKIYGQYKIIRTYSGHQFIGMAEVGIIKTDSIYNVPSSMRFFTGGDRSIRGFDYESVAPEDNDNYLIGGKYLTVMSTEYRYPLAKNWKLAFFADAGTATDDFSEDFSSSVGTGIVWASPVGPIRFYVAKPVTNKINSFAIHFMIGP
ncbi:MAG: autotransporter assembly complex family protein [Psychromonas sp.]